MFSLNGAGVLNDLRTTEIAYIVRYRGSTSWLFRFVDKGMVPSFRI